MTKTKQKSSGDKPRVIYWFRTDLRFHDSPALKAALDLKPECLYPVWCWDPHYVYRARGGPNRWKILLECLDDVSESLKGINPKQKLLLIREGPITLLPKLFKAWNISHLVFEKDTDAYARDRDTRVQELANNSGVEVISVYGRTLFDPDELVKANGGKPTMNITQVERASEKIGHVPRPIDRPKSIPDPGKITLNLDQDPPNDGPDWSFEMRKHPDKSYSKLVGPKGDFAIPTMDEVGLLPATTRHKGGESVALASLAKVIKDTNYTATFEKPKTAPTAFEPPDTTVLSHHLHFGSLSCREFYWRVQDTVDRYKKQGKKTSQPPTSLTGQLLFRDMYFGAQAALGHLFSQTIGNSHCRFVPWHLPAKVSTVNKDSAKDAASADRLSPAPEPAYDVDSTEAEQWFQRWRNGTTGFPFVDALMRQLKTEGWIHHLGRHMVACFLTRGGCYVDWQRGAEVFEEWLIDHEVACNVGNWQWLSCTAFYSQFYRCYSPYAFGKKWGEAQGARFIKRFVPELANMPDKYIFEPTKCPISDQKKAGMLIKGDGSQEQEGEYKLYPKPMFDFAERREICIRGMKKAYEMGLYGNNPKVLDGTWRELFPDEAEGPTEGKGGPRGAMIENNEGEGRFEGSVVPKGQKRGAGQGTLDGMVKRSKRN
ncbi:cryptochrome-2 [Rhizodiscina lignyota]|uniref:Cryptochrome-2 n=1 Tax=Rhizodiscina lignyota TaxID=1504668 RepID=A0A9P4IK00_9PEZI|nr:cryptochrome-2 [Rhizodiscina lignyota]